MSDLFPLLGAVATVGTIKAERWTSVDVVQVASKKLVRKVYRQPIWLAWRTLWVPCRAAREWRNLTRVRNAGVPCIEALAWDEERVFGCVRKSALLTTYVEHAPSLKQVLADPRQRAAKQHLAQTLGSLVRRLHDAGFLGARITPRNFLVVGPPTEASLVLLDLPAALAFGHGIFGTKAADIDLWDAALSPGRTRQLSRGERMRLLRGYFRGDRLAARAAYGRLAGRPRWRNEVGKAWRVAVHGYLSGLFSGPAQRLLPMRDFTIDRG